METKKEREARNERIAKDFLMTLNAGNSVMAFAFGVDANGKVKMCANDVIEPEELKRHLRKISALMGNK